MPTITSPTAGDIAYRTSGEGPTALVLVHGWAGSGAYFDPLIRHLDPELVYCISMDLPGHGASATASTPYTLDVIADSAVAAADAAGADTFVLLGFSMSAKFAQFVTWRHPDRVLGQVLVAGCPAGELALPAELIDDWCSRAGDADGLADVVVSCASRAIPPELLAAVGREGARASEQVLRETIELCARSSFLDEVAGTAVPTLVVGGAGDWLFPPDALREGVVAPLADASLSVIDCGHEIPLEAPQELAQLVTEFVARSGARTGTRTRTAERATRAPEGVG